MQYTRQKMKRLILFLLLLSASCSYAEIMEFENFSLDIPEGWTATENKFSVRVDSADGSASLLISTGNPDGKSIGDMAVSFALELGGTMPEKDEDGGYSFEFNNGRSQAAISGGDNFYMLIIGTGAAENETLGEILDSLELK